SCCSFRETHRQQQLCLLFLEKQQQLLLAANIVHLRLLEKAKIPLLLQKARLLVRENRCENSAETENGSFGEICCDEYAERVDQQDGQHDGGQHDGYFQKITVLPHCMVQQVVVEQIQENGRLL